MTQLGPVRNSENQNDVFWELSMAHPVPSLNLGNQNDVFCELPQPSNLAPQPSPRY